MPSRHLALAGKPVVLVILVVNAFRQQTVQKFSMGLHGHQRVLWNCCLYILICSRTDEQAVLEGTQQAAHLWTAQE